MLETWLEARAMTRFTVEFDDTVLSPKRFRYHVLRVLSVSKHRQFLTKRQHGKCHLCHGTLNLKVKAQTPLAVEVHHFTPVKQFAYNVAKWPNLSEAYKSCHALKNLRAMHHGCNQKQNRLRGPNAYFKKGDRRTHGWVLEGSR